MKKFISMNKKSIAGIFLFGACCALVGALCVGAYLCKTPTSYVSMDVNPSIEYTLNLFNRVLSVRAVNEDGAEILKEVNLSDFNNQTIDEAIKLTLNEIAGKGYFDGNMPGGVVIATSGKETDVAENLAKHLKKIVTSQCAENNHLVSVETMTVNQTQLDEAKALGVTPGKLLLVRELQEETSAGESFATAEWLTKSVREIMAEVERVDALEDAAEDAAEKQEDAADAAADAAEKAEDELADTEKTQTETDTAEAAAEKQEDAEDEAEEIAEKADEKNNDAADAKAEAGAKAAEAARDAADAKAEADAKAAEAKAEADAKAAEDAREAAEAKAEADAKAAEAAREAAEAKAEADAKAAEDAREAAEAKAEADAKAAEAAREAADAAADAADAAADAAEAEDAD